jgi:acyl dehydratase
MARLEIHDLGDLRARMGHEVAVSEWVTITQEQLAAFAEVTSAGAWAAGFLLLSLVPRLAAETLSLPDVKLVVNYGLNRVRFVAALRAGHRVRARFAPSAIEDVPGGVQLTWTITIETEGGAEPLCVAESVSRRYSR